MNMIAITSTNVRAVGYDPAASRLRVEFRSGGLYEYFGVPVSLYEQLLLPYPWRRVGRLVCAYPTRRLRAA